MIQTLRVQENRVPRSTAYILRHLVEKLDVQRIKIRHARLRLRPVDLDALREVAGRIPILGAMAVRFIQGAPRAT
jgi:hypothetical protein